MAAALPGPSPGVPPIQGFVMISLTAGLLLSLDLKRQECVSNPSRSLDSIDPPQGIISSIKSQIKKSGLEYAEAISNENWKDQDKKNNVSSRDPEEVTSILRNLWSEVLPISPLAAHEVNDNMSFFALGGNSVLAEQFVAICRTRGIILNSQAISAIPTIRLQTALVCGHCRFGDENTESVHLVLDPK
ncbi:hypothetical protein ACHAQJ_001004 [Trichoderma viride]